MLSEADAEKVFELAKAYAQSYRLNYPTLIKVGARPNPSYHHVVGVPQTLPKGWVLEWPGQSMHISRERCAIYRHTELRRFFNTVYYNDNANNLDFIYDAIGGDFPLAPGNSLVGIRINFVTQTARIYTIEHRMAREIGLTW